jgi:hypothetical protein
MALAAFVGGCTNHPIGKDDAFDGASKDALLVVGVDGVAATPYRLDIRRFDPETGRLAMTGFVTPTYSPCRYEAEAGFQVRCQDGAQYRTIKIPPGHYAVASVGWDSRATSEIPHDWSRPPSSRLTTYARKEGWKDIRVGEAARFTVAAGEIVYLGTFKFDARPLPAKLLSYRFDNSAAEAAVRQFGRVSGPVVPRSITLPPPIADPS